MSKKRRFYQYDGKDWFIEDMGNTISISGILLEGMNGSQLLAISPAGSIPTKTTGYYTAAHGNEGEVNWLALRVIKPSLEEWSALIRQTDNPVYFTDDETGMAKVLHRKQRRAISGAIQQQIWVRDQFTCVFCLRKMGDVPLTVDHFLPLEMGGENVETNYISACRRCNKDKGSQDPEEYCERVGVEYNDIINYMAGQFAHTRFPVSNIHYWDTPHSLRKKKKK